jgi:hypothetical protein
VHLCASCHLSDRLNKEPIGQSYSSASPLNPGLADICIDGPLLLEQPQNLDLKICFLWYPALSDCSARIVNSRNRATIERTHQNA